MLRIDNLICRIGGRVLIDQASVAIPDGHRVGLIGANGTGKTTLLSMITGEREPDSGAVAVVGSGRRLGWVAQEAPGGAETPREHVLSADRERAALMAERDRDPAGERVAEIESRLAEIGAAAAPARAATILAGLGFDEAAQSRPLADFSGGWRMRVAIAAQLFAQPDLLLLDEPTNHLDLETTLWLQSHLARYPGTLLLVSHDRDVLNAVANHILHLENGKLTLYRGNYDTFERTRSERMALNKALAKKQSAERAHLQAFVDRFRAKASKARQAQSRLKRLAKLEPVPQIVEATTPKLAFPQPETLSPPMITLDRVAVGYADRPVLRGLDLRLDPDDRIALVGANGNGKSTLARLLSGRLAPMAGTITRASRLRAGFFAQHQIEDLDPAETACMHLARAMPDVLEAKVRARLGQVGLSQEKADTPAASLSGGEKARLTLALAVVGAPQLLILDEPTNHLDIPARSALITALNDFSGAVVLISHDRHLLEATVDRLWLVADGTVTPFDGDLDDYQAMLLGRGGGRGAGAAAGGGEDPRKQRRRAAAEARERVRPLRQAVRRAEREMARLSTERERLDRLLAHPDTYQAEGGTVAALGEEKGMIDKALAEAEVTWLAAAEALQTAESALGEG